MLKDNQIVFDPNRDEDFKIPESVESFSLTIYRRLYAVICEKGKLEFERTKTKEEILRIIHELLQQGKKLGHATKPSDEMLQYFAENFDTECLVEFLSRKRRTYMWPERRHDYMYIEQDLPLADDNFIAKLTERVLEWGRVEDEIIREKTEQKKDDESR